MRMYYIFAKNLIKTDIYDKNFENSSSLGTSENYFLK